MKRIGVWNTAFLGDAVLTLPLLQSLKKSFPEAEIDFYVRRGLRELFSMHPDLHAVYEYDKRGAQKGLAAIWSQGRALRARGYDLWISAHPSARSSALSLLSGAKMRIGYTGAWHGALAYTHLVERCFDSLEEIERLLQLLRPLPGALISPWPRLVLPEADMRKAADYFAVNVNSPALGLHPGSVWGTKRWPAECFAKVAALALEAGAQVLLFAGPGEEDTAAQVLSQANIFLAEQGKSVVNGRLLNLAGQLSLPELAAYLGHLQCYVTNDSGPMHLAWAQCTPVTAVFGPTVQALGFFPRGEHSSVLEASVPCRPCGLHGPQQCPKGHHECMREVLPETVWRDVQRKLFRAF